MSFADAETFVAAAASAAGAQPEWAKVPAPVRGRAIAHIGRLIEDNAEALARLVTREIGKPYAEALGEVREIVDTCDFFLGEGRRLYGQTVPSEMSDKQLFTFRKPVGTVAVITAGNFPVAVPSWYIVPALLAGNTIVWKPAEYSAVVSAAFHELFVRGGGLPDGVFNIVHADGPATFDGLQRSLELGHIDKVGFTGSSAVGREIGALTGRHLQTACLELGGKNPLVVTPSADLDLAVEGALFSGFGTAGQRCTSLGTVIVHESVHDEFLRRFNAAVAGAAVGDPSQDVLMGPMLDEKFATRVRGVPRLGAAASRGAGRVRPDHRRQPAQGLRRRSRGRAVLPPGRRRRRPAAATRSSTRRRSGRWSASRRTPTWPRRSSSPTPPATGCRRRSTRPIRRTRSPSATGSARAW